MLTVHSARKMAAHIAGVHRSLGNTELREHFHRVAGDDADDELWVAFRTAYFDALWATAAEVAPGPVVTGSERRGKWKLAAAGHLTLSFTAGARLEMVDQTIELL